MVNCLSEINLSVRVPISMCPRSISLNLCGPPGLPLDPFLPPHLLTYLNSHVIFALTLRSSPPCLSSVALIIRRVLDDFTWISHRTCGRSLCARFHKAILDRISLDANLETRGFLWMRIPNYTGQNEELGE